MGRRSKRATKIRHASEFNLARLASQMRTPAQTMGDGTWTLAQALEARDAQLRGQFGPAARLAKASKTDHAIFTAHSNRLEPQKCIGVAMKPANTSSKALAISSEGEALYGPRGIGIETGALESINAELADHGVAFGYVDVVSRHGGTRVDHHMKHWPIEFVRWDENRRKYMARVESIPEEEAAALGPMVGYHEVPITHGDGRWIIFQKHSHQPWKYGCIVPGTLVWAAHSTAVRDWSKGSTAHGNAKVVGEMPPGMDLVDANGDPTPEAAAFLALLQAIASLETPAGIRPAGSAVDYITNNSTAWQVWERLALSAEKAAARIYLGTDGMLGSVGGAPGVDIATLFGVATTKIQSDLGCIEQALMTGLIEPWAAMNFGDSSLAPSRCYLIPDPDAKAIRSEYATNSAAFNADIAARRENGFAITQELVEALAKIYNVEPGTLASQPAAVAPAGQQGGQPAAAPPRSAGPG